MPWNDALSELQTVLASLYLDKDSARNVTSKANLNATQIEFKDVARDNWFNILERADREHKIKVLIEIARKDHSYEEETLNRVWKA